MNYKIIKCMFLVDNIIICTRSTKMFEKSQCINYFTEKIQYIKKRKKYEQLICVLLYFYIKRKT